MLNRHVLLIVCFICSICSCSSGSGGGGTPIQKRILFIGNSYTGSNNLPGVVERLSQSPSAAYRISCRGVTPGGATLATHVYTPSTLALIDEGWDMVVLQDQSLQPTYYQNTSIKTDAVTLVNRIKNAGATPMFYMTWPRESHTAIYQLHYPRYYRHMADSLDTELAPVACAWALLRQRYPSINLYTGDGSHPSTAGTYLTACVFYNAITGNSPVGLNGDLSLDQTTVNRLQLAAQDAWNATRPLNNADALIGHWELDNNAIDDYIYSQAGILLGNVAGPSSAPNKATNFGSGPFIIVPYSPRHQLDHISLAVHASRSDWSTAVGDEVFISRYKSYELAQNGTDMLARIYSGSNQLSEISYDVSGLGAGWHHFTLTYDGSDLKLYIDGTEVASTTGNGVIDYARDLSNQAPLAGIVIGNRYNDGFPITQFSSATCSASLADIRLYNEAIDATSILALPLPVGVN